jgi:quercetin dioxygenase-like cupin family protein
MQPMSRVTLAAAAVLVVAIAVVLHAEALPARAADAVTAVQQLPDGPGKAELTKLCSACHDLMFTVSTRETEEGWTQIVNDMRGKGADGADADFAQIITYLAAHMGKAPPAAAPAVPIQGNSGAAAVLKAQVQPDQLKWAPGGPGIQTATVLGDPAKPGIYVTRLRFAKGTRIMPHMHPDERVAVVLSGTMYFAYGDTFDEAAMTHMVPGSTWTEPAKTAHFAFAKDEDVVIQVVGAGPSGSTPVTK